MRILNIAEKPSVSKLITSILTNKSGRTSTFPPVYTFDYKSHEFYFTSVLGHLLDHDFIDSSKNWVESDPMELFRKNIKKFLNDKNETIANILRNYYNKCDCVIIWTDCDREGENIGFEVKRVLINNNKIVHVIPGLDFQNEYIDQNNINIKKQEVNQMIDRIINVQNDNTINEETNSRSNFQKFKLEELKKTRDKQIYRARFNAITSRDINYALNSLTFLNKNESDAVDARIELDLRIGSCFTRILTLKLDRGIISYGSCQIPTLGFVVRRAEARRNFIEEEYYSIKALIKEQNINNNDSNKDKTHEYFEEETATNNKISNRKNTRADCKTNKNLLKSLSEDVFTWSRGNVFDQNFVIHIYNILKESYSFVKSVEKKIITKYKPLPLRTVELQKASSSLFRISSHLAMQIAENLYNRGYISYPRTETDSFPLNFDFKEILNELKNDFAYKQYIEGMDFEIPRKGGHNDMAHSPIYPLKNGSSLKGDERKIYDYVSRRFIACTSKNAIGEESTVTIAFRKFISENAQRHSKDLKQDYRDVKYPAGNSKDYVIREIQNEITMVNKKNIMSINKKNNLNCEVLELSKKESNLFNEETFICHGLIILERNYLEIFTYEKWNEKKINDYIPNTPVSPMLKITHDKTKPPCYLTESELITLMDKNGIGTDATIAEHIDKIQKRNYAHKERKYIKPTNLGTGLIQSYRNIGLGVLEHPTLRSNLEKSLLKVTKGKSKDLIVKQEIEIYRKMGFILQSEMVKVKDTIDNTNEGAQNSSSSSDNVSSDEGFNTKKTKEKVKRDSHQKKKKFESKANTDYKQNTNLIVKTKHSVMQKDLNCNNNKDLYDKTRETIEQRTNSRINRNAMEKNKQHQIDIEPSDENAVVNNSQNILDVSNKTNIFDDFEAFFNKNDVNHAKKLKIDKKNKIDQAENVRSIIINCQCALPSATLEVKNNGKNHGRKFYVCNKFPKECAFFQWVDECSQKPAAMEENKENIINENNIKTRKLDIFKEYKQRENDTFESNNILNCYCNLEAVEKRAKTDKNNGKRFLRCCKAYKPCKFFQWLD